MKRHEELQAFKTEINLSKYAAYKGYELDSRNSSQNCAVMRSGTDKIVISVNENAHWMYFSVSDLQDSGTIIDFVQNRFNLNLGQVRQELRPWLTQSPTTHFIDVKRYSPSLKSIPRDIGQIRANFLAMKVLEVSDYLEESRKIPIATLWNERFKGKIHTDERSNVIFAHYNLGGVCGYEIKNKNFTGFAPGGLKGIWHSKLKKDDTSVVIVESGIDALSYATIFPDPSARYLSIGGSLNDSQPTLIQKVIERMPSGSKVILAMDNDEGGENIIAQIFDNLPSDLVVDRQFIESLSPERGSDWNDFLRSQ